MAQRDLRLGNWGIYDEATTNKIGLQKAVQATITHLEHALDIKPAKGSLEGAALPRRQEISRLRGLLRGS